MTSERVERETDFWGHHIPPLERCIEEYRNGSGLNTRKAIDALEPLEGKRVLDFACGQGITACLLADRGAIVTGIDITPESVDRARQLAAAVGSTAEFVCADIHTYEPPVPFDRVFGRYALHHVDPALFGKRLASLLAPGGWGSFLETTFTNPVLRYSRGHLVGKLGVARYGTLDERPLDHADIERLGEIFGGVQDTVAEMSFLRILDRNVLKCRWPAVSRACAKLDDTLQRYERLNWLSYHHVLVVGKPSR